MEQSLTVLAAAAHPDDIEFMMAGTLARLVEVGCNVHLWNLANGCCGSVQHSREEIVAIRWEETQAAAKVLGAVAHPPLFDDVDIFYDRESLARVTEVVREIGPDIVLTQSPQDYMEDHQNTTRLIVSAAFCRGMKNYPGNAAATTLRENLVALYHALPHGLTDSLRQSVAADFFVDVADVLPRKREMLACHRSQKEWLDHTQGMNSYLDDMEAMSREVGRLSDRFAFAEGWRRHSHLGFAGIDFDPLRTLLPQTTFPSPN